VGVDSPRIVFAEPDHAEYGEGTVMSTTSPLLKGWATHVGYPVLLFAKVIKALLFSLATVLTLYGFPEFPSALPLSVIVNLPVKLESPTICTTSPTLKYLMPGVTVDALYQIVVIPPNLCAAIILNLSPAASIDCGFVRATEEV
jgi:hypothetical protein